MIRQLLARWNQNRALIWQIDKLVAEKQMLMKENGMYSRLVVELESEIIKLKTRSFSTDE